MAETDILTLRDEDEGTLSTEDNVELIAYPQSLLVTVENPWAGDSETGFGHSCSLSLSPAKVRQLIAWLTEKLPVLDSPKPPPAPEPERHSLGPVYVSAAIDTRPTHYAFAVSER